MCVCALDRVCISSETPLPGWFSISVRLVSITEGKFIYSFVISGSRVFKTRTREYILKGREASEKEKKKKEKGEK